LCLCDERSPGECGSDGNGAGYNHYDTDSNSLLPDGNDWVARRMAGMRIHAPADFGGTFKQPRWAAGGWWRKLAAASPKERVPEQQADSGVSKRLLRV